MRIKMLLTLVTLASFATIAPAAVTASVDANGVLRVVGSGSQAKGQVGSEDGGVTFYVTGNNGPNGEVGVVGRFPASSVTGGVDFDLTAVVDFANFYNHTNLPENVRLGGAYCQYTSGQGFANIVGGSGEDNVTIRALFASVNVSGDLRAFPVDVVSIDRLAGTVFVNKDTNDIVFDYRSAAGRRK